MEEIDKELKDALQKLENCCPGSTRVSHMQTASTELHKALLILDNARKRSQRLDEERDALLKGLEVIRSMENELEALEKVLEILQGLIRFDDFFILRECKDGSFSTVVSSSPLFEDTVWHPGAMFKHALSGNPTNIRNTSYSTDWQEQSDDIRRQVVSALITPLNTAMERAVLICTSNRESFFNKSHMQLVDIFISLVGQLLCNLKIKELLGDETGNGMKADK